MLYCFVNKNVLLSPAHIPPRHCKPIYCRCTLLLHSYNGFYSCAAVCRHAYG